ncbi:MAG: DMT family transporter [Desulfobacteraceae bacterium]|nr:DMT family transporter [Desulfobacteraceae bacterium]
MTSPPDSKLPAQAVIFTVLLCVVFGANPTAIKISLTGIGKFTAIGIRFSFAATALAIWAVFSGRSLKIASGQRIPLIISGLMFTLQFFLFYTGISMTYASRVSLLSNGTPFVVAVLAHFFIPGERINISKIIGLLMGFTGVTLILADPASFKTQLRVGDFIIMAAVLVWAGNGVYTKTIIKDYHPFQIVFYQMIFAAPFSFLAALLWDEIMIMQISGSVLLALFYQSLICAAIGFVAWNSLLKKYGASTLHSFIFIMPVSGLFISAKLLNEPLTKNILAAMVLIAIGVVIVNSSSGTPNRS